MPEKTAYTAKNDGHRHHKKGVPYGTPFLCAVTANLMNMGEKTYHKEAVRIATRSSSVSGT